MAAPDRGCGYGLAVHGHDPNLFRALRAFHTFAVGGHGLVRVHVPIPARDPFLAEDRPGIQFERNHAHASLFRNCDHFLDSLVFHEPGLAPDGVRTDYRGPLELELQEQRTHARVNGCVDRGDQCIPFPQLHGRMTSLEEQPALGFSVNLEYDYDSRGQACRVISPQLKHEPDLPDVAANVRQDDGGRASPALHHRL